MLLNLQINNIEEWKVVLDSIHDITDEAMFVCDSEGISFRTLDPSHVSLLEIKIPSSSFSVYEYEQNYFGLLIAEFKNAFDAASNEDTVKIQIQDEDKINIFVEGTIKINFSLKLLDKGFVTVPKLTTKPDSNFIISLLTMIRIVTNLEKISEYVQVKSDDQIHFSGEGDSGDIFIDVEKNEKSSLQILSTIPSCSKYSSVYMAKIVRNMHKICDTVDMTFATNYPLLMHFESASNIDIKYYLAPLPSD